MVEILRLDGIVGPTHHYGGLAYGNRASMKHGQEVSHPQQAALQGLDKMKRVMEIGGLQGVLPPHPRPYLPALGERGYEGSVEEMLKQAHKNDPRLLSAISSASAMWAANAGTVSPGFDTAGGRLHVTPANLSSQFHRSLEAPVTTRFLRAVFGASDHVVVHDPLSDPEHVDEGGANHMQLYRHGTDLSVEIFVYDRRAGEQATEHYPARQTFDASRALAELHGLDPEATLFLRQNPEAVEAGVFHNDVAGVSHENLIFYHEDAYEDPDELSNFLQRHFGNKVHEIRVPTQSISLTSAVETYLFNSQILSQEDGSMLLLATEECRQNQRVQNFIEEQLLPGNHPLDDVEYVDVRQSMKNGGGPACLRLRFPLAEGDLDSIPPEILLTHERYKQLRAWIQRHYRETLHPDDLANLSIYYESRSALKDLWDIMEWNQLISFEDFWEGPSDGESD